MTIFCVNVQLPVVVVVIGAVSAEPTRDEHGVDVSIFEADEVSHKHLSERPIVPRESPR